MRKKMEYSSQLLLNRDKDNLFDLLHKEKSLAATAGGHHASLSRMIEKFILNNNIRQLTLW